MRDRDFQSERRFFLVFDPGDEFVEALRRFAAERGIAGAWFSGIGAFSRATIAWWNRETKQYERIEIEEQVEVMALNGDVGVHGDETRVHAHAVLGRRDGSAVGGHLMSGLVYPTIELSLDAAAGAIRRERDPETGLSLVV